jgi:glycosyltransferase involved in cell wall biosynthesis
VEKIHFSVITVVFNDLEGLKKTRKSLDKQRYRNWLHIIVDGGSSDGTIKYLKSLPTGNTVYVSEKDAGIYNAMNKGWKLAEPESFAYFLNARDEFASFDSLKMAALSLKSDEKAEWGCTTHEEINPDGTGWVCKLVAPPSIRNQLYAFGYRSHQGVVMKVNLISRLGGFSESFQIASDWELIARAIKDSIPTLWAFPLGRFELGGASSQNLLLAHLELRVIRSEMLVRHIGDKILDDLWCAIYLRMFGFTNYFSFLVASPIRRDKAPRVKIWKLPRTLSLGFIEIRLKKPIQYRISWPKLFLRGSLAKYLRLAILKGLKLNAYSDPRIRRNLISG